MEKIDPQVAAKVWQRVRGNEKPAEQIGIQTMVAWEKETEAILQWLLRRLPDKSYALQQLIADTRRHIACLQGIRQLNGEKIGAYSAGKSLSGEPVTLLRRCYSLCLQVGARYAARAEDEQYGGVFGDMARTKRRHCAMLLEILGGGVK
ncbi:MAG: hypothetical protein E7448_01275 [Ruminococcaceae bacterium]|nr:hypothetical protein [Oscillospiraceae bacterium]